MVGIHVEVPYHIPEVYPDMSHAEDWDLACEVAGRWISDEMGARYAENFCLIGDAASCQSRLEQAMECGIKSFYIRHSSSYTLPTELVETFGTQIIPRFAAQAAATADRA